MGRHKWDAHSVIWSRINDNSVLHNCARLPLPLPVRPCCDRWTWPGRHAWDFQLSVHICWEIRFRGWVTWVSPSIWLWQPLPSRCGAWMQAQPRGSYTKTASFSAQREERRLEATPPPHTHAFRPEASPNPSGNPWPCATPLAPVTPSSLLPKPGTRGSFYLPTSGSSGKANQAEESGLGAGWCLERDQKWRIGKLGADTALTQGRALTHPVPSPVGHACSHLENNGSKGLKVPSLFPWNRQSVVNQLCESESHSVMSASLQPHGLYRSMEFSRPEYWNG